MKKILLLVILCLVFCGCENTKQNPSSINKGLDEILAQNNYIVVDVRTSDEYNLSHVIGSINIPVDEINDNLNLDKSKAILVYCQSGNRSSRAYNILKNLGYDVYDLGAFNNINLPKE